MMKLLHLRPDLELCREPAVLADVIEINVIEEIALNALLLLLIVHPPEQEAEIVGSSSHGKARPGRGLHSRGAEPTPAPPVCKGEDKSEHQQENPGCFVYSKALQNSSRTRSGHSHGIFGVFSELSGIRSLLKVFAALVEGGVQIKPGEIQPSSTKKCPSGIPWSPPTFHQFSPPFLPTCTAASPPKINTAHAKKPQPGFKKVLSSRTRLCSIPLVFSNPFSSDSRAYP